MAVRIVKKPVKTPWSGLVWAAFGSAFLAGFLLGGVIGGWRGARFPGAVGGGIGLSAVTIGLVFQLARISKSTLARIALLVLFLCGWVGALLLGHSMMVTESSSAAQFSLLSPLFETIVGIALALAGLFVGVFLSFRRPADSAK